MKNLLLKSKFKVPIYNINIWVVVAHDPVKALRRLAKRFKQRVKKNEAWRANCVTNLNGDIGLFFYHDVTTDDVGHEVDHAIEFALDFIGSEVKRDELITYLTGYLHKRVHGLLNKHQIKPRNK